MRFANNSNYNPTKLLVSNPLILSDLLKPSLFMFIMYSYIWSEACLNLKNSQYLLETFPMGFVVYYDQNERQVCADQQYGSIIGMFEFCTVELLRLLEVQRLDSTSEQWMNSASVVNWSSWCHNLYWCCHLPAVNSYQICKTTENSYTLL